MRPTIKLLLAALSVLAIAILPGCNKQAEENGSATANAAAVENAGIETADIKVQGMHCDNCRQSIEGAVGKMAGVQSVSADFEKGEAIVGFDPSMTSLEAISREIESLGFTVPGPDGGEDETVENDNPVTSGAEAETEPASEGNG